MKESLYSIKDIEVLTGIKAHTIRMWEKRYNLITPERTSTNIRYYSDDDLKRIMNIALLVKNGYRISKVASFDEDKIRQDVVHLSNKQPSSEKFMEKLTFSLINFDHAGFLQVTDDAIRLMGFDAAMKNVFFPFFQKIGTFWQVGSIFPAQEHFISNLFRQKLIVEIDRLGWKAEREGAILFFLHEKEMHELSLLYYTYLARELGYAVIYLGQFVPLEDLRQMATREGIRFVFTSFLNAIEKEELEKYLAELHQVFQGRKIFITGYQVMEKKPVVPRNVKVVADNKDFDKYFR